MDHVVVGPPGCGKTSWIQKQVARAVEEFGPDRCMVVSLTRAAAHEAAGRTQLPKKLCGTLHSICYHALDRPKVVSGSAIKEWNEAHPSMRLTGGVEREDSVIDERDGDGPGDPLLELMERSRHTMTPLPKVAERFAQLWTDFKEQTHLVDFTDMIERAYHEVPLPPGGPSFLLNDEYQDDSDLELALLRRWSHHVEHFALVGDPAQSIYAWRHASSSTAGDVPTIPLKQSYRVPRVVQESALELIRGSSTYTEVPYLPRRDADGATVEGSLETLSLTWKDAEDIIRHIAGLDGSVMVLASCAYMLNPLAAVLKEKGIPFHNPYSTNAWNPLASGRNERRTVVDRLESWMTLCEFVAGEEAPLLPWHLRLLVKTLKQTAVTKESKELAAELPEDATAAMMLHRVKKMFTLEALAAAAAGDSHFLLRHCYAESKKALQYPIKVLDQRGLDGLLGVPQIILGTIHSVKGGQADHVILAPDLSPRGNQDYKTPGWARRDGVIRMFYVGMTRTRQSLTVLNGHGWKIDIPLRRQ